jgi:hypothetical protein
MSASMHWDGLKEFEEEFGKIPETLVSKASPIVKRHAEAAAADIRNAYPVRTTGLHPTKFRKKPWYPPGLLKGRVTVSILNAVHGNLGAVVKSNDPIAWLFDNGSQARHYTSRNGAIHDTGKMWGRTPPTHLFVRTMITHRRAMYDDLKDLLVEYGFVVSGEQAA